MWHDCIAPYGDELSYDERYVYILPANNPRDLIVPVNAESSFDVLL